MIKIVTEQRGFKDVLVFTKTIPKQQLKTHQTEQNKQLSLQDSI